jgi:hypothetical protein
MRKKAIRVLLMVVLTWLALPASVSAFYNPSTGRWLSRDPAADPGAVSKRFLEDSPKLEFRPWLQHNLMQTARNDLLTRYDYLGLDHRQSCCPELNLWTPCEAICRMAWFDREANHSLATSGGTVLCYHEKACGCVGSAQSIGFDPGRCPQIDQTVQEHEDNHAKKAKCKGCGLHVASTTDEFPGVDLVQEECEQRRLQIQKLKNILDTLDEECKTVANAMIAILEGLTENCP